MRNPLSLPRVITICFYSVVLTLSTALAQQDARSPEQAKKSYDTVVSNLDTGGDLLVVANVEKVLENAVDEIVKTAVAVSADDPDAREFASALGKLRSFLKKNGFFAINGLGMSVVPRADGLNDVKSFVSREPAAARLPLWLALVGGKPRKLTGVDYLPADTVFARVSNSDVRQAWKMVNSGVHEVASPEAAAAFDEAVGELSAQLGITVDSLVNSIADEGFVSVQFSSTKTISLPSPTGFMEIPQPSILVGLAVSSNALSKVLDKQLAAAGMPVVSMQLDNTTLQSITIPLPSPIPIQPTYAIHSGYFLFGSDAEVVTEAITAFKKKSGLASTAEFKKAFAGLPMVNNAVVYVSPRFMKTIIDIQEKTMDSAAAYNPNPAMVNVIRNIISQRMDQSCSFVMLNLKTGVQMRGISTSGARQIVTSAAIAPVGLLAAIAVPSFVKARTTSQQNACINNLRIMDAAKEQWAMAERKQDGDETDIPGISEYMRGMTMPTCPQGGVYKVNAIGLAPECNIPEHRLPY
jgi:hypothetical protein